MSEEDKEAGGEVEDRIEVEFQSMSVDEKEVCACEREKKLHVRDTMFKALQECSSSSTPPLRSSHIAATSSEDIFAMIPIFPEQGIHNQVPAGPILSGNFNNSLNSREGEDEDGERNLPSVLQRFYQILATLKITAEPNQLARVRLKSLNTEDEDLIKKLTMAMASKHRASGSSFITGAAPTIRKSYAPSIHMEKMVTEELPRVLGMVPKANIVVAIGMAKLRNIVAMRSKFELRNANKGAGLCVRRGHILGEALPNGKPPLADWNRTTIPNYWGASKGPVSAFGENIFWEKLYKAGNHSFAGWDGATIQVIERAATSPISAFEKHGV
ncbi:hypothetical protein G7Y89_g1719 [Cudoniella acicularis]|uniref:Uncharacterized protein n=1 Tax=Cudoniella acicularis TaxID=354080 RepID=A0A8H4W9A4_9HELO|nr:hypothetical protein G7Y89_g1719 [Cudoniella acicularis]